MTATTTNPNIHPYVPSNNNNAPTPTDASATAAANPAVSPPFALSNPTAPIGRQPSPLNNAQQFSLFQQPTATVDAVNNNISNLAKPIAAPQMNTSPLAGLTTLGNVSNAGNTNINTGTSGALTGGQIQQINNLNAQAHGQGPSLAEQQAKQVAQTNIANQAALIASQRGSSNSALGLRSAGEQGAAANQQAVQAAVQGRTAEELNAQQQLTGALGTAQGQTMQGAQAQAALDQQTNAANIAARNAAMQQQGAMTQQTNLANAAQGEQTGLANLSSKGATNTLNANQADAALQAQINQANNQQTANENYAGLVTNEDTQLYGINAGVGISNTSNALGLIGAGIAGGAAIGAAGITSDENLKTNIKSGTKSIKDFLSKVSVSNSSSYNLWSE